MDGMTSIGVKRGQALSYQQSGDGRPGVADHHVNKVLVKLQAHRPALLRMKLGGHHVVPGVDAAEGYAVFGGAGHGRGILGAA